MQLITKKLLNMNFPAMAVADELIQKVRSYPVTIVMAPTGSGKTVALVPVLAQEFATKGNRVTCTQNKRKLAVGAAEFVADLSLKEFGFEVGYRIGGDKFIVGRDTFLEYVTTDVIVGQYLLGKNNLQGIGTLVIDEAHEQTTGQVLLLSLAKRLLSERPDFRLVIMSATLGKDEITKYKDFYGIDNVAVIEAPGSARMYPVIYKFTKDTNNLPGPDQVDWNRYFNNEIIPDLMDKVREYISNNDSDILVFLPGLSYIKRLGKILNLNGIPWVELHGRMPIEDQEKAIQSNPGNFKVILSTNVARSGLTFKGLKYVISSKISRYAYYDIEKDLPSLGLTWTDIASLKQEAGRTGRTCPGTATIIGNNQTDKEQALVSITQEDFSPTLLKLLAGGITPREVDWFIKPPFPLINNAYNTLRELEAVDDNDYITPVGLLMAKIPLNPRLARTLVAAAEFGVAEEVAEIISVIENSNCRIEGDVPFDISDDPTIINFKNILLSLVEDIKKPLYISRVNAVKYGFLKGYLRHVAILEAGFYNTGNFVFQSKVLTYGMADLIIPINLFQIDGKIINQHYIAITLDDVEAISKSRAKELLKLVTVNESPEERLLRLYFLQEKGLVI